jgi:hypothetical protein
MESTVRFLKTLFECFFVWHVPPSGCLHGAGAIVAQASSATPTGAGKTNDALARVINELNSDGALPTFLQGEIKLSRQLRTRIDASTPTQRELEGYGRYIDTHDVALFHKMECVRRCINTVIVVAHPLHLWRVVKATEKTGLNVLVPRITDVPFDPASDQWFCRHPLLFIPGEIFMRLVYLLKGWI